MASMASIGASTSYGSLPPKGDAESAYQSDASPEEQQQQLSASSRTKVRAISAVIALAVIAVVLVSRRTFSAGISERASSVASLAEKGTDTWVITMPPTARPTNPTVKPTFAPSSAPTTSAPSLAQTTCSAFGRKSCVNFNLVASTKSGYVYTGFWGSNSLASSSGSSTTIAQGTVYYSPDKGTTFNVLTAANACTSGQLGGIAAGEDSSYSYVWYICNPIVVETTRAKLITTNWYGTTTGVCRTGLKSGTTSCISTSNSKILFTSIKNLVSSGDGSRAVAVGAENNLLMCSVTSTFASVSCSEVANTFSGAYGAVALDNTGSNIIAAPATGSNLAYASITSISGSWNWITSPTLKTSSGSAAAWTACASNKDFTIVACAQYGGYVYVSSDGAKSWGASTSSYYFDDLAMTSAGTTWVAVGAKQTPYVALSATGLSWTQQSCGSLPASSTSIATSSSFYYTAVQSTTTSASSSCNALQSLYKSSTTYTSSTDASSTKSSADDTDDDGDWTWETTSSLEAPYASACVSSDGSVIAAVVSDGTLKVSTNSGADWSSANDAGSDVAWSDIISSSDGSLIVAVNTDGTIWKSADFGSTFTQADSPSDQFLSVKCSRWVCD